MYNKNFLLIILLLFAAMVGKVSGAPVFGKIYDLAQPDGTTVTVRIWGDEFYQVVESLDGYTLIRDSKTREICYAVLSNDSSELLSTGISATGPSNVSGIRKRLPMGKSSRAESLTSKHIRISKESAKKKIKAARGRLSKRKKKVISKRRTVEGFSKAPQVQRLSLVNSTIKGICLIVDFPDEAGTIPPANIDNFCNKVGYHGYGNNGSVRDYFYDVSDGNLTYTNYVTPEYYTAEHNKSYYDSPSEEDGPKAVELIVEALNALEADGFDFTQYDADNDGYIDAINCFYAGTFSGGWGSGLWPHSWWDDSFSSADGMTSWDYQITGIGEEPKLGTFCHESGHMICWWPDLYDYDYDSSGVGDYCLMAHGSSGGDEKNPHEPCAYLKIDAGWATVMNLVAEQSNLSLTAGVNSFYKIPNPDSSNEYYLISNRQKSGRDTSLPDAGIAIWQIDTTSSNDYQQMTCSQHYLVTLVQADGNWDLENNINGGDSTDLYDASSYDAFTLSTNPSSAWWCDGASRVTISNISAIGSTMTFAFIKAVYVDDATGNDTTGIGTQASPYKTVEKAVQIAQAGDTIIIINGDYPENITINKRVTIQAQGGSVRIGQ